MKKYNFTFENKTTDYKFYIITTDRVTAFKKAQARIKEQFSKKGDLLLTSIYEI